MISDETSYLDTRVDMEGVKVIVKWDGKCYPAIVLERVNESEVEVEFADPKYPPEIVPIADIAIKRIAGEFDWKLFRDFFMDITGEKPLQVAELRELDLKSTLFSPHASERCEERYRENMQELRRSIDTDQWLACRETRWRVVCGSLRIDCTPDLKAVVSVQNEESSKAKDDPCLTQVHIRNLRDAIVKWNQHPLNTYIPDIELDDCKLLRIVVSTQVVTTTSRFVLNRHCSRVVTVIKLDLGFKDWQKRKRQLKDNAVKYGQRQRKRNARRRGERY